VLPRQAYTYGSTQEIRKLYLPLQFEGSLLRTAVMG